MVKCPKCDSDIDHLEAVVSEYTRFVVRLPANEEEKKEPDYDPDDGLMWVMNAIDSPKDDSFICPSCGHELATDEEEVVRILKGGE